ncbi:carbohydrate kinase family protein [Actinopolymorpha rutila]|uniref:Sugar/nucleoside kinase (Ribokinase family) n=1 Tax=Actinopolymorpha rutila TaxID=446787 RepID=A0A852Z5R2_9ACTN|nr:PfkB family carbohydrate kinase [Actinopolymorpha rutila]NYH87565.1 sugar/nucleoside kinase (ribokinase family) [Actinopolymorpha rutila]
MSRLVFVGSVNDDAIAVVPHLPGPDQRLLAEALVHAGGGNSATAAVAAARLGGDVAFVGPIADDPTGERIVADLTREGVDVSGVVPVPAGAGGASVVLVDRSSGTRAICTRPLPAFELGPRARDLVAAAAWVHLDHLGWPATRDVLVPDGPRVSVDAGNPIPGFHPRGVHLYGPTVDRLRLTYGEQPVGALLERARDDGAGLVVATAGADGAHLLPASGEPVHVPGFAVEVVSTLGAGDVFHGALLLAVDRGLDLPDAVRYANGAAALACRAIDGRSGVPTHDELTAFLTSRP